MASGSASCGATTKSATIEQVATDRAMVGSEFFKFLDVMLVVWASATGAIGQKFYGDLVLRPLPNGIHMEQSAPLAFGMKRVGNGKCVLAIARMGHRSRMKPSWQPRRPSIRELEMLRPRLPHTNALGRLSAWKDTSTDGPKGYRRCAAKSWPSPNEPMINQVVWHN